MKKIIKKRSFFKLSVYVLFIWANWLIPIDMIGEWKIVRSDGDNIECPDFIVFTDKKYKVFNDCEADNPSIAEVLEKGDVLFSEGTVILKNRIILSKARRYFFISDQDELEIKIVEASPAEIIQAKTHDLMDTVTIVVKFEFKEKKKKYVERLHKVDPPRYLKKNK